MSSGYLPNADGDLLGWVKNCAARMASSYAEYGIPQAQAEGFVTLAGEYAVALAAVQNRGARTGAGVIVMNAARTRVKVAARGIVALARAQPDMVPEKLIELGASVRKGTSTPAPRVRQQPRVSVRSVVARKVSVQVTTLGVPGFRLPPGVKGMNVFIHVGDRPPERINHWTYALSTTKTKFDIDFPRDTPAFSKVWISCFYLNNRLQRGMASIPLATNLGTWEVVDSPIALAA
jgi:hypothetical protein